MVLESVSTPIRPGTGGRGAMVLFISWVGIVDRMVRDEAYQARNSRCRARVASYVAVW